MSKLIVDNKINFDALLKIVQNRFQFLTYDDLLELSSLETGVTDETFIRLKYLVFEFICDAITDEFSNLNDEFHEYSFMRCYIYEKCSDFMDIFILKVFQKLKEESGVE